MNRLSDAVAAAERKPIQTIDPAAQAMMGAGAASELTSPGLPDSSEATVYNHRNIILVRQGNKQSLDLLKFFRTGDLSQNPFLRDGDVLILQPVHATVTLEGCISKDGEYEFRTGDTLRDLLELALGFDANADLKHIIQYRYNDDYLTFTTSILNLSGYEHNPAVADGYTVQPGDRILVPVNSEYRKSYRVSISGKVRNAGIYYVNDATTLYDLLLMCGGPVKEADMDGAYLYNKYISEEWDPDFERLKRLSMPQMTWMEYSFLRTKERQLKGKYAVDIRIAWETKGKDANQLLRDGDELVVPEAFNAIWVTGQVKHPGIVEYQKSLTWKQYIEIAGGFTNNRKFQGTRIIRAYSGNWVKPTDKTILRPGDTIFVPEQEETTVWSQVKEAILLASQVLTVIIALKTF
jgi:protein involved in polysaccharide export with SLBB domain